jgi:hypothetical protein
MFVWIIWQLHGYVGGYSDSPLLIGAIKDKFPNLSVIVPRDPGLAVLKGAVLYGCEPHSITERVTARSVLMLAISGLLNSSSKTLRTFSIE